MANRLGGMALAAALALGAGAATAQDWRGEWSVADPTGLWILSLGLQPHAGEIEGQGRTYSAGIGPQDNAPVAVLDSTILPNRLRLDLEFGTHDGSAAAMPATLVIFGDGSGGEAIARFFVGAQARGFVTLRREAATPPPLSTYSAECLHMEHQEMQAVLTGPPDALSQVWGLLNLYGFDPTNPVGPAGLCAAAAEDIAALRTGWAEVEQPRPCARIDRIVANVGQAGTPQQRTAVDVLLRINALEQTPRLDAGACRAMLNDLSDLGLVAPGQGGQPQQPAYPQFTQEQMTIAATGQWSPAYGGTAVSYWAHNTSGMAWEVGPGNARNVWYWEPRQGLVNVGVQRGTLLFDGLRIGDRMEGTARIFTSDCGVWTYAVSGPVRDGDTSVVLRGERPEIGPDCRVTGSRADELVFTVLGPDPFYAEGPAEADLPAGGLWAQPWRVRGVQPGDWLNFRAGPGTRFTVIDRIPRTHTGLQMQAGGCDGISIGAYDWSLLDQAARYDLIRRSWCQVTYGGQIGWVYGRYIEPM